MKDSKLKIILPIVLIPIVLVMFVVGYVLYLVQAYNNGFKDSISEKDIIKYLQSKNEGEFRNLKLINNSRGKFTTGGMGCPTAESPYDANFYFYYTVYSVKYDTEFFVTAEKDIFTVTLLGCRTPDEKIVDDLEDAKNNNRYLEIIHKQLSNYNYNLDRKYKMLKDYTSLEIEVKINDEFNKQYYNELLKLKTRLIEEHRKLLNEDKKVSIDSIKIVFNDRTFRYSDLELMTMERDGEIGIEIESPEFWKYIIE